MADNANNIQATLSLIDKVYAELNSTGRALNRALLITLLVSLLQLFAAAEWVSTKGEVALLGLGIKVSYVALGVLRCAIVEQYAYCILLDGLQSCSVTTRVELVRGDSQALQDPPTVEVYQGS
jgi:hypothetical protein